MTQNASGRSEIVRDVVRMQTDTAHAQLHLHASFVSLFEGRLSLDDYCALMQRFHGFYAPLDQAIERVVVRMSVPYPYVCRSDILARDLADLGGDTMEPHCTHAALIVSPETLPGVLYVIEGATLGATQIDRAVQKLLGSSEPDGRRFWAWCRAQNKHRWSMANNFMEAQHTSGVAVDDIVRGARDTFETLGAWLAPLDVPKPALQEVGS